MTQPPNISPLSLQSDYMTATDQFITLQTSANLLEEQKNLNLHLPVDAGLAEEITLYQTQIKNTVTIYISDQSLPSYIDIFNSASNFCALWQAAYQIVTPKLKNAYVDPVAKKTVSILSLVLQLKQAELIKR
ncbi:MAG: hypothetical protein EWV85_19105 [Microcystis aeruginosa Ma_QC_C_20070703_M131]|jgi:hypothetical protein|uniref:Uncharacterized protein n=2 Tax=Microcystis aeruginosa TaxID=1126 RepID=A0A551XB03_MICAE|nr:hypothetical protein [Microcystis aeruginosa CS-579]TRT45907.1 MAG: hypothetical protein EWV85_19105 [Microcystis aeruginosa Ma_QC_C_20070703_M131]